MGSLFGRKSDPTRDVSGKEWQLLEKIAMQGLREQRAARRWGVLFKSLTFAYLLGVLVLAAPLWKSSDWQQKEHVAVINVAGVIAEGQKTHAAMLNRGLREAFDSDAKAIILAINSPGGSPVQADQVFREVVRLRATSDKPVIAVISDIGASGAYYIAAAADEIFADKVSLVGSIGVISAGFGFVDVLDKVGLERRLFTSGTHKAMLDAFSPLRPDEQQFWRGVLDQTHRQFVSRVKEGRGDRLSADPVIFSGLVWSGEQALELGLIDGFGSARELSRERFSTDELIDYTPRRPPLERLMARAGAAFSQAMVGTVDVPSLQLR